MLSPIVKQNTQVFFLHNNSDRSSSEIVEAVFKTHSSCISYIDEKLFSLLILSEEIHNSTYKYNILKPTMQQIVVFFPLTNIVIVFITVL